MLPNNSRRLKNRRAGNAILEFAIGMPLLMLLTFGAVDFARVFYHAVTLANAAGVGAFYGSQNNIKAAHFPGMSQAALDDSRDLTIAESATVTVASSNFCDCPDAAPGATVDCFTATCPGYGSPRGFVRVQATETFRPLVPYPGIPEAVSVGRVGIMRAR